MNEFMNCKILACLLNSTHTSHCISASETIYVTYMLSSETWRY